MDNLNNQNSGKNPQQQPESSSKQPTPTPLIHPSVPGMQFIPVDPTKLAPGFLQSPPGQFAPFLASQPQMHSSMNTPQQPLHFPHQPPGMQRNDIFPTWGGMPAGKSSIFYYFQIVY